MTFNTAERAEELPIDLFIDALRKQPDDLEAARNWSCGHTDHVRTSAALALGKFGARAPIEFLLEMLDDGDASVRREAVTALGMLGEYALTEPILAALGDDDIWVREAVFEALKQHSKVGKLIPKESLFSALANSEETIRALSIDALRQLYPNALSGLIPEITAIMLGQREGRLFDSLMQSHFAEIIGNIGYPSSIYVEKLSQLVDWPYWEVRMKAIEAFGKLHQPLPGAILRRLLELRHDPQSRAVRKAANEVLDKLLSLETCIEDNEEAV